MFAPRPAAVREYALDTFRPSLWYFANSFIGAAVVLAFGGYILYANHDLWRVGFAVMALGVLMILAAIIRSRSISWRLTSDRLIEQRGILARSRREMELADIRSVELTQRVIQRALRLGDITIASAASTDFAIRMHDVASPAAAAETVRQARLKRLA
jgi:uncharacterized membrane protein YdbT with pleckstrin-like domain